AELFNKYRKGTQWWDKIKDETSKEKASALARQAMQENIHFLFRQAAEKSDRELYKQAIADSRDYLEAFPDDSSAAIIHWNMALALDTKLGLKNEAFDEYIKISNTYWDSKYQKQAAENAVALADEYVRSDSLTLDSNLAFSDSLAESVEEQRLTPEEEKLVLALNNYIELFPHEQETAKMLAKAGSIHYNRHQFRESLKYFKTLARHFPDSDASNQARFTIMESYFGKGDYESTEIIAKKIKEMAPEFADKATRRLAESIFFQAKSHAETQDHVQVAEEYRRVVTEVPNAEFADVALYNSGLEFDKAKRYDQAIESYDTLIKTHPQSEHYLSAVNNLAFDYRELGNFRNAAETYERLADIDTSATGPQVALYNASVSYVQAEDWQHAIQVNDKFVARFPQAEDADDLLFNNAQYYLKLNDLQNANRIYESFAQKYPDSPKAIEAFYHRGKYFAENDRPYEAKLEYDKAVKRHEALKAQGKDANDFYTSEALFQLAEIKFQEFDNIQFRLPKKAMAEAKGKKKAILKELVDSYTRVAGLGTIRVYESTFKIGSAYEGFARSWAQQEIPPMDDNQRVIARKEINQTAAELYEKAIDAYKNGAQALEKLAAKQRENSQIKSSEPDANKLSNVDSTLAVAENWIKASKTKVSENLFAIAEIYNESLEQLLNVPIPPGMKPLEQLVYRQQVLEKAVAPIAKQVVDAHVRNLTESQKLQVENQWTALSAEKIFKVSTIVPDALQKLSARAFTTYRDKIKTYEQLVEADDESAFDMAEELANLLDLGSTYVLSS
ncbi:MAG: tetratricopeptide repeat protein, partial [bacterium]